MPSSQSSVLPTATMSFFMRFLNSTTSIRPFLRTGTQSILLSSASSHSPPTLKYSG